VPPSDIVHHLAKLLQQKENADVTFMVGGQAFPAHKTVLAMRSPVFKDELYGTTGGKDTNPIIAIDDMQFKGGAMPRQYCLGGQRPTVKLLSPHAAPPTPMAPVCRLLRREKESGEDIIQGKQFPVHNGEPERRPAAACAQFFTVCF
jgi:hypothetical protein